MSSSPNSSPGRTGWTGFWIYWPTMPSPRGAEPGCRVFDVCQTEDRPDLILLYEVYDTEPAYLEHRATDHFARFLAQAPDLVQPQDGGLFLSRSVLRRRG